jgi:putative transcriptional regulator
MNGGVPYSERVQSLRGHLLVAAPSLLDPNFARTVVLIAEHTGEGALGVVLNRPSDSTVGEVVPDIGGIVDPDQPVFSGGPVQPSGVMVLAEFSDPDTAALTIDGDLGFVALESDMQELDTGRSRAFAGHAGWGPGQLDAELEEEAWFVASFDRDDAFIEDPDVLWSRVLERKGGAYALVARMPLDPSLN